MVYHKVIHGPNVGNEFGHEINTTPTSQQNSRFFLGHSLRFFLNIYTPCIVFFRSSKDEFPFF